MQSLLGGNEISKKTTYGAITPRTSDDLVKPVALSHSSRSDDNFVAGKKHKTGLKIFNRILQGDSGQIEKD